MIPAAVLLCVFAGVGAVSLRRSPRCRWSALFGMGIVALAAFSLLGPLMEPFVNTFLDRSDVAGVNALYLTLPVDLIISLGLIAILAGYAWAASPKVGWVLLALLGAGHLQQSVSRHQNLNSTVPTSALSYRPKYLDLMTPPAGGRRRPGSGRRG